MTHDETIYVAAILEGEGCFVMNNNSPRIQLSMTDEDIVRRVSRIVGGEVGSQQNRIGWKTAYVLRIGGIKAIELMKAIKPHMGSRRSQKIDEIINEYESSFRYNSGKCRRGHDLTNPNNYWIHKYKGYKRCKLCAAVAQRKYRAVS